VPIGQWENAATAIPVPVTLPQQLQQLRDIRRDLIGLGA
jgi:hypothetical protein